MTYQKKRSKPNREDKTGVIYARYSSHNQKDASIEQQVEKCMDYARRKGLTIIECYEDRAISGRTDQRSGFQRMMRDAAQGKFEYVVAWKSNRMGRDMLQAMQNGCRLAEMGIRCVYVEENFDDSAAGRFALRNMMNVNQFYSENMAEDIRRGMRDNAAQCKVANGKLPYGYKIGADLKYEIEPKQAEVLREIYSRVACGELLVDIAADLNARGITTSRGNKWGRSSFHSLLHNERYTGVYIYDDIRIEDGVPQIIDKGLFYRVQEVLQMKNLPKGRHRENCDYLLTGKLFCGHCKTAMVGISGTSKNGTPHRYYACQKKRLEKACDKKNVRKDLIERAVTAAIKEYILQEEIIELIADQAVRFADECREQTQIGKLEADLEVNKKALANILKAIEQGIITATTKDRLIELENEQSAIKYQLDQEKALSQALNYTRDDVISMLSVYRKGDIDDVKYQADLIENFLISVFVYDDHLELVFNLKKNADPYIFPFDVSSIDDLEAQCSYKLRLGPPKGAGTNTNAILYMVGEVFVLVYPMAFERKA